MSVESVKKLLPDLSVLSRHSAVASSLCSSATAALVEGSAPAVLCHSSCLSGRVVSISGKSGHVVPEGGVAFGMQCSGYVWCEGSVDGRPCLHLLVSLPSPFNSVEHLVVMEEA